MALGVFAFLVVFYSALPILREYLAESAGGGTGLALGDPRPAKPLGRDLGEDA